MHSVALVVTVALAACAVDAVACSSTCQGQCPVPIAVRVQRTGGAPLDGTKYALEIQTDTGGKIVTCTGATPTTLACDDPDAQEEHGFLFVGFSSTPTAIAVTVRDGSGAQLARQTFSPTYTQAQVCSQTCEIADDQVVEVP